MSFNRKEEVAEITKEQERVRIDQELAGERDATGYHEICRCNKTFDIS